jgi:ribonuclease BN (tRNA processing enzyme)
MPSAQRETSAYLVKRGNAALLLDAGTGTRRLVTEAALLSAVETLDVAFSHFHGDHVTGLSYLPAVSQRVALGALFVPGHPVYADGKRLVRTLLQSPYQPFKVENIFADMREMGTRIGTAVGHIQTRWQMGHSDPSLAFRLEDLFAYCTDTPYDGGNVDFASGCSLLMHEAWNYGEIVDASHSSAKQAGRLAQESRCGRASAYTFTSAR